jgi:hypothetical protein
MVGIVYYADDVDQKIFRKVYLARGEDETQLDDPKWITLGCNPNRTAVMVKVADDDPLALGPMTGAP